MIEFSHPIEEEVEEPVELPTLRSECTGIVACGDVFYVFKDGNMQVADKEKVKELMKEL